MNRLSYCLLAVVLMSSPQVVAEEPTAKRAGASVAATGTTGTSDGQKAGSGKVAAAPDKALDKEASGDAPAESNKLVDKSANKPAETASTEKETAGGSADSAPAAVDTGSSGPSLTNFKVVALLHLTGEYAAEGKAFQEGIELAAEDAKPALAAAGKSVSLTFDDTGYNPATASTAAAKVTSDTAVSGVLVSTVHEIKAFGPALERAHIPSIVLWDSSPELEAMGEYIFGIGPWTPDSGRKAADFVQKTLKTSSAYIVSSNNDWSSTVAKSFLDRTLKNGADVLGTISVNPQDRDFLTIISQMRKASPEAIYAPLAANLHTFAKQVDAGDVKSTVIVSDVITNDLLTKAAKLFEGYYQTMPSVPEGAAAEALKTAFVTRYSREPANLTLTSLGYDGMKLLAHAIETGGNTREAVRDVIAKVKEFPGVAGPITMNNNGSAPRFVSVYQVKQGKFELVEKADGVASE